MSMSELRSQNGIGDMSWPRDKEELVDDSGKTLKDTEFSFESPKSSRSLFIFIFFFFQENPIDLLQHLYFLSSFFPYCLHIMFHFLPESESMA